MDEGDDMESMEPLEHFDDEDPSETEEIDYKDLYLRTLADFDNYRKRTERDREEIAAAGKRDLLLSIVDVVDNFERAMEVAADVEDDAGLAAGVLAIYRQLRKLLESYGVERLESAGGRFDPELQEAVGLVASEEVPEDFVVGEGRPGYRWNGRLLRPARVFVSTGPSGK